MAITIDKINSGAKLSPELKSNKIEEMKADIGDICQTFSLPSNQFDVKKLFGKIKDYVSKYDRLLYAEISTYCYNLASEEMDKFQGNLNSLIEYVHSWDFENGLKAEDGAGNCKEVELRRMTKRIVIKLYDNVNLACAQMNSLRQSEEELHRHFITEFEPAKAEITKDINSQLISLVGIFTAIAFLVFGGFSSLTDVFSHIGDDIPKTIMLLSIWGLVICNGVFVFLGCIEKLIYKERFTALFSRNGIVKWSNMILLLVFSVSIWTFIVDKYNLGTSILHFLNSGPYVAIIGFFAIILVFIVFAFIFNDRNQNK